MRVLILAGLLVAFIVRADEPALTFTVEEVQAYIAEMEARHERELERKDERIAELERIARKVKNWNQNCRDT